MEMIDVLNKLQEIADKSPEVAKAIESVKQTNPKEVEENAVESEAPTNKEPVKEYEDKIQEYHVGSYKDFLASKGVDIYKISGDEHSKYAQLYKAEKEKGHQDATVKKGTDDHMTKEGGMSDVHIGAQEVVGEYVNDDGNLVQPKKETLQQMALEKLKAPFPKSYEIETAMQMVNDKFDNNGQAIDEVEPEMASAEPEVTEEPAVEEDMTPMGTKMFLDMGKKLDINFDQDQSMMVQGVLNTLDQEALATAVNTYKTQNLDPDQAESTELNTNTMTTEDKKQVNESKKPVKEAITMTADSPEEAGMLMQMLKLAGVQQVTPDMIGAEVPADNDADAEANPEHGDEGHDHSDCPVCGDDAVGSNEMGQMRNMISQNDGGEQAEETFANEPDEKVSDVDTLVNVHSGGLNKQKQQVRKEYPGDNPLASKYETVEDKVSEEDLSNSLRTQYEGWKKSYKEAAKITEKKGKDQDKDGDVDSKDWKKSKDIAIKKAIADKK